MSDLRRSLGFIPLVALGAASVIGASWIYTNGTFFARYGVGGTLAGIALAGGFVACIALAYAELGAALPRAGGEVVYAYACFGRPASFTAGWLLINGYISSLSFYVTSVGFLLGDLFPGLRAWPLYAVNGQTVTLPVLLVGLVTSLIIFALNYLGVNLSAQIQLVLFAVMVLLGTVLAVVAFTSGSPANAMPLFPADGSPVGDTLRFMLPAMTFFSGFGMVVILAEDARLRPARIGLAAVAAVAVAGAFYLVVLLASTWVWPWQQTTHLPQGMIETYRVAGFPMLGWAAYTIALLGLVTSFLGLFTATSRVVLALARIGLLPTGLAQLHRIRRTPARALLFTLGLTLALGWLGTGAITWFLDTGGIYLGLVWALGVACLYQLPRRYPELERPYRVRLRWLPALGGVVAVAVIAFSLIPGTSKSLTWPQEYLILAAWLLLGLLLYSRTTTPDETAVETMFGEHYHSVRQAASNRPEYDDSTPARDNAPTTTSTARRHHRPGNRP